MRIILVQSQTSHDWNAPFYTWMHKQADFTLSCTNFTQKEITWNHFIYLFISTNLMKLPLDLYLLWDLGKWANSQIPIVIIVSFRKCKWSSIFNHNSRCKWREYSYENRYLPVFSRFNSTKNQITYLDRYFSKKICYIR